MGEKRSGSTWNWELWFSSLSSRNQEPQRQEHHQSGSRHLFHTVPNRIWRNFRLWINWIRSVGLGWRLRIRPIRDRIIRRRRLKRPRLKNEDLISKQNARIKRRRRKSSKPQNVNRTPKSRVKATWKPRVRKSGKKEVRVKKYVHSFDKTYDIQRVDWAQGADHQNLSRFRVCLRLEPPDWALQLGIRHELCFVEWRGKWIVRTV